MLCPADSGNSAARGHVCVQEGGKIHRNLPVALPEAPVRPRDPGDDRQASGACWMLNLNVKPADFELCVEHD